LDEEVMKYWQEFETSTGETVEAKTIGEIYEGNRGGNVWCLLVLTDKSFWFKQVPSDNWVTSLFRPRSLLASSKPAEEFTLSIPRGDLVAILEPGHRFHRWFCKPAFPILTLTWRDGGTLRSRQFSMDPSADLLPRLRALLPERNQDPS
jgi:hypothetical protein